MKFEEIKVNEIYEASGANHRVLHKHEGLKAVFTVKISSNNPYAWTVGQLEFFKPIALPKTGLIVSEDGSIVYRTGERSGYGFSLGMGWYDNDRWGKFTPENWRKATPEDEKKFKKLLIQEAAKRGLVDGVESESASSGNKWVVNTDDVRFNDKGFLMGVGFVFHDGKWATPIKNEKQDELDSTIEKLFKLGEELGIEVLLTLDNKEK